MNSVEKFVVQDLEYQYIARVLKNVKMENKEYIVAVTECILEENLEQDYKMLEGKVTTSIGLDNMVVIDWESKKCLDESTDNEVYYHVLAEYYK